MTSDDITLIKPVSTALTMRSLSTGETYPLDGELLIGREVECQVRLNSPTISRYHAKITLAANGAYIEDLHSSNGTFVNGHRVTARARLALGDEISFENITFRITNRDSGDEDATRLTPKTTREILEARVAKMQITPRENEAAAQPIARPKPQVSTGGKSHPTPASNAQKPRQPAPALKRAESENNIEINKVKPSVEPAKPVREANTPPKAQNIAEHATKSEPSSADAKKPEALKQQQPQRQQPQQPQQQDQASNASFAETIEALKNPVPLDDIFDDIKEKFGDDSVDAALDPAAFDEIDKIQNSASSVQAKNTNETPALSVNADADIQPNAVNAEVKAQPNSDHLKQDLKQILEGQDEEVDNTELVSPEQLSRIAERNLKLKRDLQIGTGPRLVIMSAPTRGKVFPLEIEDDKLEWKIGRDQKAQIHIPEQAISSDHARVTLEEEGFVIATTHATNGMLINGKFASKKLLSHNDTIQIGRMELVFKTDAWEPPKEESDKAVKNLEKNKSRAGAYVGAAVVFLAVLLALIVGK